MVVVRNMLTVYRPDNYIYKALSSYKSISAQPMNLHVGTTAVDFLSPYVSDNQFNILPVSNAMQEMMNTYQAGDWTKKNHNVIVNFNYTLLDSVKLNPDAYHLILEDDVVFRSDFDEKLDLAIAEAAAVTDTFILSIYSRFDVPLMTGKKYISQFPITTQPFYGNQGLLLSPKAAMLVLAAFEKHLTHDIKAYGNVKAADDLIKEICLEKSIALFQTHRSLIQHIGRNTTGVQTFWHTSPTFEKKWQHE